MEENKINENKELVLFENSRIRRQMYNGEWYYSIVDIIEILTESKDPTDYWSKLKKRIDAEEFAELSTNCRQLKLVAKDGKNIEGKLGKPVVTSENAKDFRKSKKTIKNNKAKKIDD